MRRLTLALIAAIGLTLAAATPAAARPAPAATFTLQGNGHADAAKVAALWSKGTGVTMTTGVCDGGNRCIRVHVVDFPCNGGWAGCAYLDETGTWRVEVSTPASWQGDDLPFNTLGHEVGHAVLGTGYHNPDERSIMHGTIGVHDRAKGLTRDDKATAQNRY